MRFLKDNRGIESTEVALIIAVVVLVSYGAYRLLGQNIAAIVTDVAGRIYSFQCSVSNGKTGRTIFFKEDNEISQR